MPGFLQMPQLNACLLQDDHRKGMDVALLLRKRDEMLGTDYSRFFKVKTCKDLCTLMFSGLDVQDRLAVAEDTRVVRICLLVDVSKLAEDVL